MESATSGGCCALICTLIAGAGIAQAFSAHGSVEQVYVTGLAPNAQMSLARPHRQDGRHQAGRRARRPAVPERGARAAATASGSRAAGPKSGPADGALDPAGAAEHRRLQPVDPLERLRLPDHPRRHQAGDRRPPAAGRDERRAGRRPPAAPTGPTPTLIEYSGYGYANPAGPQSGIAVLANLMGFAVVDVNMRGTGCSGGAFDFFEPLQSLDGYDVIETIARQPWVLHHKVGMMGISYGGISQLFTAQTQPAEPRGDLAAVGDRRHADDALPGRHPQHRLRGRLGEGAQSTTPQPAGPNGGQPWAYQQIQDGDPTCAANQALHGEAADLLAKIRANSHYDADGRRPAGPDHVRQQDQGADVHGLPVDGRADRRPLPRRWPSTSPARTASGSRSPTAPTSTRSIPTRSTAGTTSWSCTSRTRRRSRTRRSSTPPRRSSTRRRWGSRGVTLPPDPIQLQPTYAGALAAFEQLPPVRVLFDNGAGGSQPGQPAARLRAVLLEVPDPGHQRPLLVPRDRRRRSATASPPQAGADSFTWNAHALPLTDFTRRHRGRHRRPVDRDAALALDCSSPAGTAVSYVTSAAEREHHRDRRRRGARSGCAPRRPTSTCRPRSARCGPTARRPSCRTAGCGRASASSTPPKSTPLEPVLSLRAVRRVADAERPLRQGHDPALLRGPRLPRRLAHPGDDRRAERRPADLVVRRDAARRDTRPVSIAFSKQHAVEPRAPGRARA